MNIPRRDKDGNIVGMDRIDNPINPVIDFNPIRERKETTGSNPRMPIQNTITADVNLGVNRVVPSNQAYWRNQHPDSYLANDEK